jgi:hypothetical protein
VVSPPVNLKHIAEEFNLREFTVKEGAAFRLRVRMWDCLHPRELKSVEFINECIGKDGEVDFRSTYEFYMTQEELNKLAEGLKQ